MIRAVMLACLVAAPAAAADLTLSGAGFAGEATFSAAPASHDEFSDFLRADAQDALEEGKQEGAGLRLTIRDQDRFQNGRFVSMVRRFTYQRGAQSVLFVDPLTWDAEQSDLVTLEAFLLHSEPGGQGLNAVAGAIYKRILSEVWGGGLEKGDPWLDRISLTLDPDPAALANFTLSPSSAAGRIGGFTFHFSPGEIAPGSLGEQTVTVPQKEISAWLKPAAKPLFGGAPR